MNRPDRTRRMLLLAVFAVQAFLLIGMVALHGARMSDGTMVRLEVVPVDPLDLARGAYVELAYALEAVEPPRDVDEGDVVFVELERPSSADGAWTPGRAVATRDELDDPDAFIELVISGGRIDASRIGTYYASAEDALSLERDLTDGGIATVALSSDGEPTLGEVTG